MDHKEEILHDNYVSIFYQIIRMKELKNIIPLYSSLLCSEVRKLDDLEVDELYSKCKNKPQRDLMKWAIKKRKWEIEESQNG
jgi:hypothetical protein